MRPFYDTTALSFDRLAPREVGVIIDHIVGNKSLPANIRQDIIERTDGIPLFVEEMTKAVLEAESESEAWRAAALVPSPALAVPASLHASLMARLDRLGPPAISAVNDLGRVKTFSCKRSELEEVSTRAIFPDFDYALIAAISG